MPDPLLRVRDCTCSGAMDLVSVVMTVSLNTITWVEPSEVPSSKTVDKGRHRPHVAHY